MTNAKPGDPNYGVVANLRDLIRVRPGSNVTGFAPGGKVRTHQFGSNRSVFRGRGMEFDETRLYQPGDEVKAIDWRVTARTGTVHTKLFHEERERPVLVLVDSRRMMHFGSRLRFKSVMAAEIAAMLCWVGIDGGDRVGGFVLGQYGIHNFAATRNRSSMLRFLRAISEATRNHQNHGNNDAEMPLHLALRRLRHVCRPGTLAFIVSDYADFDERAEAEIKRLSVHTHVTNLLIYDQLDASLPVHGDYRVSDGEEVIALSGLGKHQLQNYQQAFHDRRERLETVSRQRGMAFMALATDDDLKRMLSLQRTESPHRNQRERAA